jgi:hypothetical protein
MAQTIKSFGGRDRTLRFRPSTVRDFEQVSGGKTLSESLAPRGVSTLSQLLWSGLKADDARLSVLKVIEYLDEYAEREPSGLDELWNLVAEELIESGVIGQRKKDETTSKTSA